MKYLKKYIEETIGIELKIKAPSKKEVGKLPLYLRNNISLGEILEREILFVSNSDLTPDQYKKQSEIIEKATQKSVVFVLENIAAYNRKRLVQKKVSFVVPGKQMFIPNLFIDFKEYKNTQIKKTETLSPAAQCLLFYFLLGNKITGFNFNEVAKKLNYGNMTITRASNALAQLGLCEIEGGKGKSLVFAKNKEQIWDDGKEYLISPVSKEVYTDDNCNYDSFYRSGLNALSHYTAIAATNKDFYAISYETSKKMFDKKKIKLVDSPDAGTTLQIWKYDPGILASGNVVDPLSLFLILKDNGNERVQDELQKLIERLW